MMSPRFRLSRFVRLALALGGAAWPWTVGAQPAAGAAFPSLGQEGGWLTWALGGLGLMALLLAIALALQRRLRRGEEVHHRAMEASEALQRALLSSAADAIVVADAATGRIVQVNHAAAELLGWPLEELTGQPHEFIHPEADRARVTVAWHEHVGRGGVVRAETQLLHRDGSLIPCEFSAVRIESGALRLVQSIYRDLRPRLAAEANLRESEARYRGLFDHMPISILEEDFRPVMEWINAQRAAGVHDLAQLLAADRELIEDLFRRVIFLRANPLHLASFGVADIEEYRARVFETLNDEVLEAFRIELLAMWEGRTELSFELKWEGPLGWRSTSLVHWWVSRVDGRADWSRVILAFVDLSPLRATEAKLRENEERWALVARSANDGIWDHNLDTGVSYFSERLREMLGYSAADLPAELGTWEALIHPDDLAAYKRAVVSHLRGDTARLQVEYRVRAQDGSHRWLLSRGLALRDPHGRPVRLLGSHTDLTAGRLAEQALHESAVRYRALFENAVEGVYESSSEGTFVAVNPAFARLVGYATPAEMIEVCRDIAHRLYVAPTRRDEFFAALGSADNLVDFESEVWHRDGTTRWIAENVRALRDETGALVGLQGFVSDVTERRRVEAALASEKERLAVILQAMAEAVLALDANGRIQFCNRAAELLLGQAAGEVTGRPVVEVVVLRHARTEAPVIVPAARALAGDASCDLPPHTELVRPGRHPLLVEGRCAPLSDGGAETRGVVLVLRDVTERVRFETEMQRASKLESVGLLAGGIAHDFNNILTIVMGHLALAQLDTVNTHDTEAWLREAERGILRARDLTQQLLTFAKGGEPVRSVVSLADIVREAAEFALHGANVRLDYRAAPDLWPAEVDKGQIAQVVQNLVINAAQAMPQGGALGLTLVNDSRPAREGEGRPAGDYVRLSVTDTGVGIPAHVLARIFEPYFTTKDHGSGLGLATVYSIVRRHHGMVDVDSSVGRGTTFQVWLPAVRASPLPVEPASAAPGRVGGRVLFMDDEATIRRMAAIILQRLECTVVLAADGAEAVALYREAMTSGQPFELVIMDLTVPGGMGGREAMQQLRALDPTVRAIVSSGYSHDPVMANFREHGFCGVVAKPYRVQELAAEMQRVRAEEMVHPARR